MAAVTDKDNGYNELVAFFDALEDEPEGAGVYVGIRQGKGAEHDADSDVTLAEYATENEFGTAKIPERSFLRSTMDEQAEKYQGMIAQAVTTTIDNARGSTSVVRGFVGLGGFRTALERLGVVAVGDVKRKIVTGPFTPNSPVTIARKGSSRPLIDTGRLRNSIESEVRGFGGAS